MSGAADPRVRAYADLLLDRSIAARPGWQVLVLATTEAAPLVEELSAGLARRGAHALLRLGLGGLHPADVAWAREAPDRLPTLAPLEQAVVDAVDATVVVIAPADPPADADVPAGARRRLRAQLQAYRARGRAGAAPEVRCDFPTPYLARRAGLPLPEYEDVFYAACLRDWDAEARRMGPVAERLDRAREVRITAPGGTDLTLDVSGRPCLVDDGHANVPGGEVYLCPHEGSAEGAIEFDVPTGDAEGVRLVVRGGEVVEAAARVNEPALHEALATDDGARRFGELGVGCNDALQRPLRNVLLDEKMAGTVHLALGQGFPSVGGENTSALHWDLIRDLRAGGRLYLDGELAQADGRWL